MSLPHVTCVMTAHNYERYVAGAVRSVLGQDYPIDLLDVVVVDDGSIDGTAEVVRAVGADASDRVTLITQPNAGLAAATNTAIARARGELIAICDADDEWLPGKVRAQVEVLARRPKVALVYGDMQVIDEHGTVVDPSFFCKQRIAPLRGRVLDQLVAVNFTTNSTLMLRTRHVTPIPSRSPYADYWLVMHAAAVGEVELIERPLASYRLHAANMSFGVHGERLAREMTRELMIRRMLLTGDLSRAVSPATLAEAAVHVRNTARAISRDTGVALDEIVPVTDDERALAQSELARVNGEHDARERLRWCAVASLIDPLHVDAQAVIRQLTAVSPRRSQRVAGAEPGLTQPGRSRRLTVASADELISNPGLVAIYCERVGGDDEATLAIVADPLDLQAAAFRLRESLISVGIDPDDCPDLAVVPDSAAVRALVPEAVLTCWPELSPFPGVPPMPLDRTAAEA